MPPLRGRRGKSFDERKPVMPFELALVAAKSSRIVKGCAMPALKPHACERAGEPAGRRRTSLDGGTRGVLRCDGNLTRLWRLKRSHYQSGDGELRQTRR